MIGPLTITFPREVASGRLPRRTLKRNRPRSICLALALSVRLARVVRPADPAHVGTRRVENPDTIAVGLRLREIGHDETLATHQPGSHRAIADSGNSGPRNLAAHVSLGAGACRVMYGTNTRLPWG